MLRSDLYCAVGTNVSACVVKYDRTDAADELDDDLGGTHFAKRAIEGIPAAPEDDIRKPIPC